MQTLSNYDDLWKSYESKKKSGHYQDAAAVLDSIEFLAREEKQSEQLIRMCKAFGTISSIKDEDPTLKTIRKIQDNQPYLDPVGLAISNSQLASHFEQLYHEKAYEINQLTPSNDVPTKDINAWTSIQYMDTILNLHLASTATVTRNIPLDKYKDLIQFPEKNTFSLRNTVYDLLIYRTIDYLKSPISTTYQNNTPFICKDATLFADSKSFINHTFDFGNHTHLPIPKAIKLYQAVEAYHANRDEQRVDAELNRLQFALNNSILTHKDVLYDQALDALYEKNKHKEIGGYVLVRSIERAMNKAPRYNMGKDTTFARAYLEILTKINNGLDLYSSDDLTKALQSFKNQILKPSLQFQHEEVCPTQTAHPLYIQYKNLEKITVQIKPISAEQYRQYLEKNNQKKQLGFIKKLKSLHTLEYTLPVYEDHHEHSTWLDLPALPGGFYFIACDDISYSTLFFQVSNLAVHQNDINYVHSSVTGQPIDQVSIELYQQVWKRNSSNIEHRETIYSDKQGQFSNLNDNNAQHIFLHKGDASLYINGLRQYNSHYTPPTGEQMLLFTDRSIYRPGQNLYFKGIAYDNTFGKFAVLPNTNYTVLLKDANYQEVLKQQVQTNEFGSFNGVMAVPEDRLNGRFSLVVLSDTKKQFSQQIQVESYKRPTFTIKIDDQKDGYQLGDQITITGQAEALAGYAIDNASGTFVVNRSESQRFYCFYPMFPVTNTVIDQGTFETKPDGTFEISFTAAHDPSVYKGEDRNYIFTTKVDITDKQGETRTQEVYFQISKYKAHFQLNEITSFDKSEKDKHIHIALQNSAGQLIKQPVQYTIKSLQSANTWKRNNKLPRPQKYLVSESEFRKMYPFENYSDADLWKNSPELSTITSRTAVSSDSIDLDQLEPGMYKIEWQSDNVHARTTYVVIHDAANKTFQPTFDLDLKVSATESQPGDLVEISITSPIEDLHVYLTIERRNGSKQHIQKHIRHIDQITLPITEADYGHTYISATTIYKGQSISNNAIIDVPFKKQVLKPSWITMRSTVLPGSKEKWRLKISDAMKQRVETELLVSMYDQSLDEILPHGYSSFSFPMNHKNHKVRFTNDWVARNTMYHYINPFHYHLPHFSYPFFAFQGNHYGYGINEINVRGSRSKSINMYIDGHRVEEAKMMSMDVAEGMVVPKTASPPPPPNNGNFDDTKTTQNPLRTNFNETVFFYPTLRTDASGETWIEFTMNEALTSWKMLSFAHSKSLQYALDEQTITTKKDLMVRPNGPRFFRAGDIIDLPVKIINLSDDMISGEATIQLIDLITGKDVTSTYIKNKAPISFSIVEGSSSKVQWQFTMPDQVQNPFKYRVIAKTAHQQDGEEHPAIVLPNKKLITESLPVYIPANSSKDVSFKAMDKMQTNKTLVPEQMHIEVTSNPSWFAIRSLPYLSTRKDPSTIEIANQLFSNTLSRFVLDKNPKIESTLKMWSKAGMQSPLRDNPTLKLQLLQQTPWLLDAIEEEADMAALAALFDRASLLKQQNNLIDEWKARQRSDGGFSWLPGSPRSNVYTTLYVVETITQLNTLTDYPVLKEAFNDILREAIPYLDAMMYQIYKDQNNKYLPVHGLRYMYIRTLSDIAISKENKQMISNWESHIRKDWVSYGITEEALAALYFYHADDKRLAQKIIESLRQRSIQKEAYGMYWKENNTTNGYQSNIESHATIMQAFNTIDHKTTELDDMKLWLLSNKQTNRWKSSKATAQAVYALMQYGNSWTTATQLVSVSTPSGNIRFDRQEEASTLGLQSKKYYQETITPELASLTFKNDNNFLSWGSVTWQYWSKLDAIESYSETPLNIKRHYYKKIQTASGPQLERIEDGTKLSIGDILVAKIEVSIDRPMQYVQIRDMRAAGMEPTDNISQYQYKGGLGFYQETKDTETNFYITYLNRGTYSFEYTQRVVQSGDFSAGIAEIQCMYAPAFGGHTVGKRLTVKE